MNRKKLHEKVLYPVVRVIAKKAMGSGTILYSKPSETVPNEYETYVLTNCHVVEDSISYKKEWDTVLKRDVKKEVLDAVEVQEFRYYSGRSVVVGESSVQADIVAYDKAQDLALLKARDIKKYEYVAEMFPRDGKLEMLMELLCVGCGMGERPLMTYGFLSGMNREIDNYPYHLSSANSVFGNCLPGDTLISMHDGTVKKLSDIKTGDYVLAYGEVASGLTNARVEELIESGEKAVYRIRAGDKELYASGNHPVTRVTLFADFAGKNHNALQWVPVNKLSEGDVIAVMMDCPDYNKETNCYIAGDKSLLPDDLQYARITKIEEVGVQPVYDIRLDTRHAFFANGVLVHNSGGAVFEKESMQFVGVPSRITVSLFGQAITHMGYFIPVDRVYKFLDEQIFEFIYDPAQTPSACAKRREEKREKDRIFAANVSEEKE